jgi:FkbM family methyltransferase
VRFTGLLPTSVKQNLKQQLGVFQTGFALSRIKQAGFAPRRALDLGAHHGDWSAAARSIWPSLPILLVEAWPAFIPPLEQRVAAWENCKIAEAVLTESTGDSIHFFEDSTASCIVPADDPRPAATLLTTALDDLTRNTPFAAPDLIKFDLQGAELRASRGGLQTLEHAEVLQVELNVLPLINGAPIFSEVIAYFTSLGFRLYDFGDFMRRPSDRALWWLDGIFVREGSQLLADRPWQ